MHHSRKGYYHMVGRFMCEIFNLVFIFLSITACFKQELLLLFFFLVSTTEMVLYIQILS